MKQKLLLTLLALIAAACATVETPTDAPAGEPVLTVTMAAGDSHFIELTEWAARNQLFESPQHRRFDVLVVGCAGDPECFFVHERHGTTRVLEPRLKRDWNNTLMANAIAERIRQMECVSAHDVTAPGPTGECRIWLLEKTREELYRSSPDIARLMIQFNRSPAQIDLIKTKKK